MSADDWSTCKICLSEDSVRIDYEYWFEEREFEVSFGCECQKCGARWDLNHNVTAKDINEEIINELFKENEAKINKMKELVDKRNKIENKIKELKKENDKKMG